MRRDAGRDVLHARHRQQCFEIGQARLERVHDETFACLRNEQKTVAAKLVEMRRDAARVEAGQRFQREVVVALAFANGAFGANESHHALRGQLHTVACATRNDRPVRRTEQVYPAVTEPLQSIPRLKRAAGRPMVPFEMKRLPDFAAGVDGITAEENVFALPRHHDRQRAGRVAGCRQEPDAMPPPEQIGTFGELALDGCQAAWQHAEARRITARPPDAAFPVSLHAVG